MADAIEHGTTTRGERHGNHKLKEADVLDIKRRLAIGETHDSIAVVHGVGRNTITDIAKGKNWAWLRDDEVAHTLRGEGFDSSEDGTGRGTPLITHALPAMATGGSVTEDGTGRGAPLTAAGSAVRRLTPRECERLQGFPDYYTLIPMRGKPAADGPRYRALGNSMAVPVIAWIGARIQQATP